MAIYILLFVSATLLTLSTAEVELITQPKPGQEYVFVQTSGSGARPIARKDKRTNQESYFETAHKLPPSLTYVLNQETDGDEQQLSNTKQKREANPADVPAPAPAGSIKLDPKKLIAKYKEELKSSTTQAPKTSTKASRRTTSPKRGNKRTKKEAPLDTTDPTPILTTAAPSAPKSVDLDDVPLVASGSEKQRSRIQIKKGPNGQEYEYEYVYYYYDDDEDIKDSKEKVSNSHDGPARNQITQSPGRGDKHRHTTAAPEPAVNEVVPSSRSRSRGRQLGDEDTVGEERLPANTRFPPRSRNLATTPVVEEEAKTTRGRIRGRLTTEASLITEADSYSEETQGSRGRTRANVRRPSLELVDSASFNTHSGTAGAEPPNGGPSFPTDLPAGPVRFLGATPNERIDLQEIRPQQTEEIVSTSSSTETTKEDATHTTVNEDSSTTATAMSPMDKVALDLYAILQGTQKLSGEDEDSTNTTGSNQDEDLTTFEATTNDVTTEFATSSTTTTTTTTTTTPPPTTTITTTTTTETFLPGRGRYRGRVNKKTTASSGATTESSAENKPKNRYNSRPSFGNRRHNIKTTAEPSVESEINKESSKHVSHSRPTLSRNRFGATRTRTRTTQAPDEHHDDNNSSSPATSRPSFSRPRPSFNLRARGRTTTAPAESESSDDGSSSSSSSAETSTTPRARARIGHVNSVRPLRPGPRINIARGRPGIPTTTTEAVASEEPVHEEVVHENTEEEKVEQETSPTPAPDNNPINRLRNRQRLNIQPAKPKASGSAPVQVRRINPLLARRKIGSTEPTSSEAPHDVSTEALVAEEENETDSPTPSSTTTTEEPRGLNKLLAGRRRLRQPGTIN